MFDILIVTVINWIMRTIMGQVVCATEATHISIMWPMHLFLLCINKEVDESNIYNYPEVDLDNITIETKQNDAYATNTDIITEGNQAYYGISIDMITTEGNWLMLQALLRKRIRHTLQTLPLRRMQLINRFINLCWWPSMPGLLLCSRAASGWCTSNWLHQA